MKMLRMVAWIGLAIAPVVVVGQSAQTPSLEISQKNRTISVSASDHAEADPDVADLNVGYVVYGPTLQAAYKTASDSSNAIVKAMLDAGAAKSEIQSRSQRVSQLQDYEVKVQKGMRYSVSQSWVVSVEPKTAALILDAAVQAGANQSGDIQWRMKDSVSLDDQAIKRATARAVSMAAELAKDLGVTLTKPIYATNSVSSNVVGPRMMANVMKLSAGAFSDRTAPLSVEAQRVDATATVQIIYGIE